MNIFTQYSIELANQKDYLDQLFRVYPLRPDSIREVDETLWANIETAFNGTDNAALMRALLKLNLFPVKDGYVPFLRRLPAAIGLNPNTVNRICGRVKEMGLDLLYDKCSQPKETNRQMGPLFQRWVMSGALGLTPVDKDVFLANNNNAILAGSDNQLKEFAIQHLGYDRVDKGVDVIGRFNGKYVIGEAKFISDEGGHQNDQFLDAISTLSAGTNKGVLKIAILDGVLYIRSRAKMYRTITSNDLPVMSALLLRDYLYSL